MKRPWQEIGSLNNSPCKKQKPESADARLGFFVLSAKARGYFIRRHL